MNLKLWLPPPCVMILLELHVVMYLFTTIGHISTSTHLQQL